MTDSTPLVEKVARAIDPVAWKFIDEAPDDHPAKELTRARMLKQARAALDASGGDELVGELRTNIRLLEQASDMLDAYGSGPMSRVLLEAAKQSRAAIALTQEPEQ